MPYYFSLEPSLTTLVSYASIDWDPCLTTRLWSLWDYPTPYYEVPDFHVCISIFFSHYYFQIACIERRDICAAPLPRTLRFSAASLLHEFLVKYLLWLVVPSNIDI